MTRAHPALSLFLSPERSCRAPGQLLIAQRWVCSPTQHSHLSEGVRTELSRVLLTLSTESSPWPQEEKGDILRATWFKGELGLMPALPSMGLTRHWVSRCFIAVWWLSAPLPLAMHRHQSTADSQSLAPGSLISPGWEGF